VGLVRPARSTLRRGKLGANHPKNSEKKVNTLSPSAQKVQDALRRLGTSYTVIEFAESTRTAQEAADRVGCQLGQIVKSMVFAGRTSGKPVLVLTSGANRVDEKKVGEYASEAIARADADFVRTASGFAIGGVPPLGHPQPIETYVDEDLMVHHTVWAAAGSPNAVFELPPAKLVEITNGKVVCVKRM
jgi:prolyl-tRNA editing enzyme YbaK/EbsC (Cys-tRNA(Pro) deacylase)